MDFKKYLRISTQILFLNQYLVFVLKYFYKKVFSIYTQILLKVFMLFTALQLRFLQSFNFKYVYVNYRNSNMQF